MQKTLQQLPTAANALPDMATARSTPTEKPAFILAKCVDFVLYITVSQYIMSLMLLKIYVAICSNSIAQHSTAYVKKLVFSANVRRMSVRERERGTERQKPLKRLFKQYFY